MLANGQIPVNRPNITDGDIEEVVRVLREGWVSGDAPEVDVFEAEFASQHGCDFGVAVPNGTIAIDLLISVLGIGPGDEVIMPTFAIISCLSQVLRVGAVPVFIDANEESWNMDVSAVENAISSRTRLILVVHTYGLPAEVDLLVALSERHGIPLVEDAAEAHGLKFKGKACGSFGVASTFSFYANKNVTTGEGGMICTNDPMLYERLRYFRNLTFDARNRFVHNELGWNYRFTAIQAALGRSQLKRLDDSISRRKQIAGVYRDLLENIDGVALAPSSNSFGSNHYWVVGVTLDAARFGPAGRIRDALASSGVATRPFFFPLHQQPVFRKSAVFRQYELPVAESLYLQGFYPPNGLGSSPAEIHEAAERTAGLLKGWRL